MTKPVWIAVNGISTEAPSNSMPALISAAEQGFDALLVDVTAKDGTLFAAEPKAFDPHFGASFSLKFAGVTPPALDEVMALCASYNIQLVFSSSVFRLTAGQWDMLTNTVLNSNTEIGFVCAEFQSAEYIVNKFRNATLHFCEPLSPKEQATLLTWSLPCPPVVWFSRSQWSEQNDAMLQQTGQYARLGLQLLAGEFVPKEALAVLKPDWIATYGNQKPVMRQGLVADMHAHSCHSHDAKPSIEEMARVAVQKGLSYLAITDHCDVEYAERLDLPQMTLEAVQDTAKTHQNTPDVTLLNGVEMGESFWFPHAAKEVLATPDLDVVIGSVHAVRFQDLTPPYAPFDFGAMGKETCEAFFAQYLKDMQTMLAETEFDILAHLTCPLRYINGKFGLGVDCRQYEATIEEILKTIIQKGIALEVNTSCKGSAYDQWMPERWILERYHQMGGYLITCGGDAHLAQRIAHEFDPLLKELKEIGFEAIYLVKNRRFLQCTL